MLRWKETLQGGFKNSGLSFDELGQRMGYSGIAARKSAWQFLRKKCSRNLPKP
jgi:hypothetical protein